MKLQESVHPSITLGKWMDGRIPVASWLRHEGSEMPSIGECYDALRHTPTLLGSEQSSLA